jgi:hypothetical protein
MHCCILKRPGGILVTKILIKISQKLMHIPFPRIPCPLPPVRSFNYIHLRNLSAHPDWSEDKMTDGRQSSHDVKTNSSVMEEPICTGNSIITNILAGVSSGNFQPPEVRPIPDSPNLQVCLVFIPYTEPYTYL